VSPLLALGLIKDRGGRGVCLKKMRVLFNFVYCLVMGVMVDVSYLSSLIAF